MRAITRPVATTFAISASGAFGLALLLLSVAALAQVTGTVNPSVAPAESLTKEDVPPGGCMPIGMTASGDMVFPIQCRAIIERQRGKAVEQKPAAVEEKPVAAEEKAAAKQSEAPALESRTPVATPVEIVPTPKPRERAARRDWCQNFHSYDSESGTYTDYDGRRRSCR